MTRLLVFLSLSAWLRPCLSPEDIVTGVPTRESEDLDERGAQRTLERTSIFTVQTVEDTVGSRVPPELWRMEGSSRPPSAFLVGSNITRRGIELPQSVLVWYLQYLDGATSSQTWSCPKLHRGGSCQNSHTSADDLAIARSSPAPRMSVGFAGVVKAVKGFRDYILVWTSASVRC